MRTKIAVAVLLGLAVTSCDQAQQAFGGLFEPRWEVYDANGEEGALHFGMNAFDFRIGLPEHVRIERRERRTVTKPGGAKDEQTREHAIQVVLARCQPTSICDAKPHSTDTREVVVTPLMMGQAKLYVTVAVDGKENMKDEMTIRVSP